MDFSNMSPSRGLQLLMNYSSLGHFPGVQSFRNRLFQLGSPTGSQVLPANLLQHGLLALHESTGPSRLQCGLSMGSQPPLDAPTYAGVGFSTGCGWICAPAWTSMGCRGTAYLTMVIFTGCRGNLCSGAWITSCPCFFTDLAVCTVVSLTFSHSSLWLQLPFCRFFFPLLKHVITGELPLSQWAQPWPAAGPSWSWLHRT